MSAAASSYCYQSCHKASELDEIEDDLSSMMLISLLLKKEDYFRQSRAERRKSHLFMQLEHFRKGMLGEKIENLGTDENHPIAHETDQFYMKM